jgi:hypothetical protein
MTLSNNGIQRKRHSALMTLRSNDNNHESHLYGTQLNNSVSSTIMLIVTFSLQSLC